jgi:hypothetical protein
MSEGARRLFIYYRVDAVRAAEAIAAARRLQAGLRARHARLCTALLQRPETVDGHLTLMETYCLDSGSIDEPLQVEIESAAAALAGLILGARHVEVFEPCA